jgi:REP element-mobilizing transposase RayT
MERHQDLMRLSTNIEHSPVNITANFRAKLIAEIDDQFERKTEAHLDAGKYGPTFLRQPELMQIVLNGWMYFERAGEVEVHAVCVMPNHVHAVVSQPRGRQPICPGKLMRRHKTFTANQCNRLLGRTGQAFWATNYFDRTIRRGRYSAVIKYVLCNAVAAGLVRFWQEWPGVYLNPRFAERVSW